MTDSTWPKRAIDWTEGGTAFVSVPFTWELPKAYQRCIMLAAEGYHVRAGGPAVSLMPDYLASVAEIGGEVDALPHHNPAATFTSRGCIRKCPFCAVPKIEGRLRELTDWLIRPIVCDNNFLACSRAHFDDVIDKLKPLRGVDFNQGLDARLLSKYHAGRLAELDMSVLRLAWDDVKNEARVMRAIDLLCAAGFASGLIRVYVLIGFRDAPEDALYRFETLKARGAWGLPMRYQPLGAMERNGYIGEHWTDRQLRDMARYWFRYPYLKAIPFEDYNQGVASRPRISDDQMPLAGIGT